MARLDERSAKGGYGRRKNERQDKCQDRREVEVSGPLIVRPKIAAGVSIFAAMSPLLGISAYAASDLTPLALILSVFIASFALFVIFWVTIQKINVDDSHISYSRILVLKARWRLTDIKVARGLGGYARCSAGDTDSRPGHRLRSEIDHRDAIQRGRRRAHRGRFKSARATDSSGDLTPR